MHESQLLHTHLKQSCPEIHSARLSSLMDGVSALIQGNKLSVTGLGRSSSANTATKHQIKKMDYLVGNAKLHSESHRIYAAVAKKLINTSTRPAILVDWSGASACGKYHMLSASLCTQGRALMIYNEVHEEKHYGSAKVHERFLANFAKVLNEKVQPIIITDAGYRNNWFKAVKAMGWDFIGRVRHLTLMKITAENSWLPCKTAYIDASHRARYLGKVELAKSNPVSCHLHVMKKSSKGRKHINLKGDVARRSKSRQHAKNANDPWLIATSLSPKEFSAAGIMKLYAKRMQIEETFRDLKSSFSFSQGRTKSCVRLEILLLIAALASLVLWLIGLWAQKQGYERLFQANTIKQRRVLSVIFLAKEVIRKGIAKIPRPEIKALFCNCDLIIKDMSY